MEWIKPGTTYDFMKAARLWAPVAVFMMLASLVLAFTKGFDSGIDFKGGTKVIAEFQRDKSVERAEIKKVVDDLVAKQTGQSGTQVEVQDFDVGGAAASDTMKFLIFTELPSLLTPLKKLEVAKEVEKYFGAGTVAETPSDAGDKFYVTLPAEWPVSAGRDEIARLMARLGHPHVKVVSDKEQRILSDALREKDLLMSAKDEEVKAEAARVEAEANAKIATLTDSRFTVEVEAIRDQVTAALKARFGDGFVQVLSTASVSPSVGRELFENALVAMLYAILGILIYVALRFDLRFAPGALVKLLYDVVVLFGFLSVLDIKFTLTIVAAILTVIGYDINDTIVIYDRIRENLQKGRGELQKVVNVSLNETLSRTVLTGGLLLFALLAIYFFGGGTIKDFGLVVFIGIVLGTFSSVFVAAPVTVWIERYMARRRAAATRAA